MASTSTTELTNRSLFDIYRTQETPLKEALAAFQEEFNNTEIFTVLAEWGIGIPDDAKHYGPKESYELFLGVKCEEITSFGLSQGSDLRALGMHTDIKFFCNRLERADRKEQEVLFTILREHLTKQSEVWNDKEGCQYYINLIGSFLLSTPSSAAIQQLNSELIEFYKKKDLAQLRTHLNTIRSALQGIEMPLGTSDAAASSTSIFKKLELLEKLKSAALGPDKDDLQIALIKIKSLLTKKEYNYLAKLLFLFTAKMDKAMGTAKERINYGRKVFLHLNGNTLSTEDQSLVIERVRSFILLKEIFELIKAEKTDEVIPLLEALEKIKISSYFEEELTSYAHVLYKNLWLYASLPDSSSYAYGRSALANETPVDLPIKLNAIKETLSIFKEELKTDRS